MRLLKNFETHSINGASLDFGNNVIVSISKFSIVPASACKFIEENLQKVINGNLSPDEFMNIMNTSKHKQYLEEYMMDLDSAVELYF